MATALMHRAAFFAQLNQEPWRGVAMPISWWPLPFALRWATSLLSRAYTVSADGFGVRITVEAVEAATGYDALVELVYNAVARLGAVVVDHHQGLYARDLRDHLDEHGCLQPFPAGPSWYHPADGHPAP